MVAESSAFSEGPKMKSKVIALVPVLVAAAVTTAAAASQVVASGCCPLCK